MSSSSSSNSKSNGLDPQRVKERIQLLDIRDEDLRGCQSLDQEYVVILRKTGDMKAFADPSETGFAGRIREINNAYRMLHDMYQEKEIDSFSQFLKEDNNEGCGDEDHSESSGKSFASDDETVEN